MATHPALKLFRSRQLGALVRHTATIHGVKARKIAAKHGVDQGRDQLFAFWGESFAAACSAMREAGLTVDETPEVH